MNVNVGDRGLDFYGSYPPVALVKAAGFRYVGIYTKFWRKPYVTECHDNGIGVYAIGERAEGNALLGYTQGTIDATLFVQQANNNGYPHGFPLVVCHDTSITTSAVGLYFKAAEIVVRRAGFLFGGYCSKQTVDVCQAAGVTFDLIVAPGAAGWGGGAHVDTHIKQYPQNTYNVPGYLTDLNVARRPWVCWSGPEPVAPRPEPAPTSVPIPIIPPNPTQEDDMPTNLHVTSAGQPELIISLDGSGATLLGLVSPSDRDQIVAATKANPCPVSAAQYAAFVALARRGDGS